MADNNTLDHGNAALSILLFGSLQVFCSGQALPLPSQRSQWLLVLLALRAGQEVRRDWLAETLWPNALREQALNSLSVSLHELRNALGTCAAAITVPAKRTLRLDLQATYVDVHVFDHALESKDPVLIQKAVTLYRGPLLENWHHVWLEPERARRTAAFARSLEELAVHAWQRGIARKPSRI